MGVKPQILSIFMLGRPTRWLSSEPGLLGLTLLSSSGATSIWHSCLHGTFHLLSFFGTNQWIESCKSVYLVTGDAWHCDNGDCSSGPLSYGFWIISLPFRFLAGLIKMCQTPHTREQCAQEQGTWRSVLQWRDVTSIFWLVNSHWAAQIAL